MRLLLQSCAATAVAAFFFVPPVLAGGMAGAAVAEPCPPAAGLPAAERWYATFAALPEGERAAQAGRQLLLEVALEDNPALRIEPSGQGVQLRYSLFYADIAEGWSWQPGADPAHEDYYRFKAFPAGSRDEERPAYEHEDKIGAPQRMEVRWRYDYFLAFANPYAFVARRDDGDSAFALDLPEPPATPRVLAAITLEAPVIRESTTFWKAIHARPTDFTLKKRYLTGRLDELRFCDGAGRLLGRAVPGPAAAR